jgi:hypothetical protein
LEASLCNESPQLVTETGFQPGAHFVHPAVGADRNEDGTWYLQQSNIVIMEDLSEPGNYDRELKSTEERVERSSKLPVARRGGGICALLRSKINGSIDAVSKWTHWRSFRWGAG